MPVLWGTDLWITAALLPFLVPLAVSEGAKSTLYGMEELETASRFSRKSVLLARLCLIGTFHAVLLLALTLLLGGSQGLSLGRTGPICWPPTCSPPGAACGSPAGSGGGKCSTGATALAVLASGSYSAAVFLADDLFALGALPLVELGGGPAGGRPSSEKASPLPNGSRRTHGTCHSKPNQAIPQQTGGGRGEPHPPPGGVRPAGGQRGGENHPHADALRHPPPHRGGGSPWTASP